MSSIGDASFLNPILAQDSASSEINGLVFKQRGRIIKNPPRELIPDLDMIPFPARHLFNQLDYTYPDTKQLPTMPIDFYVDVKQTVMTSEGAALVGRLLFVRLQRAGVSCVGGMAVGAVRLVTAALAAAHGSGTHLDGFFVRREAKSHGTARRIDGRFQASSTIALVEDVVTTGESTLQAIDAVESAGGRVALVVTVVDRQEDEGMSRLAARTGHAEALVTRAGIERAAASR